MIGALAQAAAALDAPRYAEAAARAAAFILTRMRTPDGRLLRTWSAGAPPKLNAYLEDYSFVIDGLVSLYEATFAPRWVEAALALADVMVNQFWDDVGGGFFYTGRDHEALIARGKDPHDNATPSGNAMAVTGLLRLVKLTGRRDLQAEETRHVLRAVRTGFRPNQVVALKAPGATEGEDLLPLLAGKEARGAVTTYVCRDFTCQAPLVGAEATEAALAQG